MDIIISNFIVDKYFIDNFNITNQFYVKYNYFNKKFDKKKKLDE